MVLCTSYQLYLCWEGAVALTRAEPSSTQVLPTSFPQQITVSCRLSLRVLLRVLIVTQSANNPIFVVPQTKENVPDSLISMLLVKQRHDLGEQYREPVISLIDTHGPWKPYLKAQGTKLDRLRLPFFRNERSKRSKRSLDTAFSHLEALWQPPRPAINTPARQAYLASAIQRRINY